MIIEFNGLPGSGKTTIAKAISDALCKRDIPHCFKYAPAQCRFLRYISYLFDGSAHLYFLGRKYAKSAGKENLKEKMAILPVLVYYYRMYRQFSKKCPDQVLIVDQGFLQGLISIVHTDLVNDTKPLQAIFRFLKKKKLCVHFVHCKNDVNLAAQRIRERKTNGGRLDAYKDEALIGAMCVQQQNFDLIRSSVDQLPLCRELTVDTKCPPEENAEKILSFCSELQ